MIVISIVALILITQIIVKIVLKNQIKSDNYYQEQEMAKLSIIPNIKKKSILATVVSIGLTLVILCLPIVLNVCLYMQFPFEMFFGKINMLFTFFLAYLCFILMNLIHNLIIKSYIHEYKQSHPEVEEELLPKINLKKVFLSDLSNVFITIFISVLLIALYFFI